MTTTQTQVNTAALHQAESALEQQRAQFLAELATERAKNEQSVATAIAAVREEEAQKRELILKEERERWESRVAEIEQRIQQAWEQSRTALDESVTVFRKSISDAVASTREESKAILEQELKHKLQEQRKSISSVSTVLCHSKAT